MTTIDRIKELLEKSGKQANTIAKEAGLKNSVLSDLKAGRAKNPSVDTIIKLAKYFNVTSDYLLGLSEEQINPPEIPNKKHHEKKSPEDLGEFTVSNNPRELNKLIIKRYKMDGFGEVDLQVHSQCPICHYHIEPKPVINYPVSKGNKKDQVVVFWCSHCSHIYSALYKDIYITPFNTVAQLKDEMFQFPIVDSCYTPYRSAVPELPEALNKPAFTKFRQAYEDLCWAKDYQIEGLVGMAYRRALECLVKDFLINEGYQTEYKNIDEENTANLLQAMTDEIIEDCGRAANHFSDDYVHYKDKNPNIGIEEISEFFEEVLEKIKDYLVHQKSLRLFNPNHKALSKNRKKIIKNTPSEVLTQLAEENKELFIDSNFVEIAKLYSGVAKIENSDKIDYRSILLGCIIGALQTLKVDTKKILGY